MKTLKDLAKAFGTSYRTVQRHVKAINKNGQYDSQILERHGKKYFKPVLCHKLADSFGVTLHDVTAKRRKHKRIKRHDNKQYMNMRIARDVVNKLKALKDIRGDRSMDATVSSLVKMKIQKLNPKQRRTFDVFYHVIRR